MVWLRSIVIALALAVALTGIGSDALAGENAENGYRHHGPIKLQDAKGDACIRDTAWMARNHMKLLKHKRDDTVREGMRMPAESILECKTCHTSREQFCDQCHNYVGVKPDCFTCHIYPK
uniref:Putative triheme c-type cytochrome DsrJ [dsrJ] n=1 Tax=Magnetococcus massalia (strain MO-1) TaxID=451514 RepID=A0A1S7LDK7_MAGMO|nr:Putative triheme c-type cytochrome DsrJ [dsrJ] [Candidatus Magnetococcus massalia]